MPFQILSFFAALGCLISPAVVATGQVHLYGGPGSLEGRFETVGGDIDMQGWVGVDCPNVGFEALWQVSEFEAENLNSHGPGNHAMWAGRTEAQRPGWAEPPGYGDSWNTVLSWSHPAPTTTAAFDVQLDAVYNHDIEWSFDIIYVEWNQAGNWQSLEQIDGRSFDGSTGEFLPPGVVMSREWTVQPADLVDGEVQIRIRVTSDGWVSDESGTVGANPGNSNGAIQIDDITVSFDGVPVDGGGDVDGLATFESGDDEGWTPQLDTCSCSVVPELTGDIDPGPDNLTPQIGLFRSASYPGTQGFVCRFTSPVIDWDIPEAQGFDAAFVRLRCYRESSGSSGGFALYLRSRVGGQWRDYSLVESIDSPPDGWHTFTLDLSVVQGLFIGADAIQILLRAGSSAAEHRLTFDDVEVVRYDSTVTAAPPAARGQIALDVSPNPSNPSALIRYVLDERASLRIALYDARGRKVRTVFSGEKSAGTHTVRFDGLDDLGNSVASGVYFVRVVAEDGRTSAKRLVIVR